MFVHHRGYYHINHINHFKQFIEMEHTEEYINELLAKYITGEVMSESEKNDIQEWIATHADEYNRLVKLISPKKLRESMSFVILIASR